MNTLAFQPYFPYPIVAAIAFVALAVALVALWRTPASAVFRALAAVSLIGLLLNPQLRTAERTALDDIAVIITDASGSNRLDNRASDTARAAAAIESQIAARGGVEIIRTTIGDNEQSDIGAAIGAALADNPAARLGGVFVITDGEATDTEDFTRLPQTAPVHLLLTGGADDFDRKVTLINAPRYGIVNEGVEVSFRIDDLGRDGVALTDRPPARVTLRVDGEEALSQPVPVGGEVSFTAPLPHPGKTVIELEVESVEGELTTRNNIVVLPISAIRDRLRVLLISGEPHAGERVWRNLLKSDPGIDLVHFTILRPIEKAQADSALERELALIEFPQDELFIEKLTEFDLVIFDRYTYRGVLNSYHFDNLARYVEDGGAVLVASGPEFSTYLSLAQRRNFSYILPATPSGEEVDAPYRPRVSDVGRLHPVTRDLPEQEIWGRWLRVMPVAKRSGETLMTDGADHPLLILGRVGEGRVGMLQSDHVWLWARGFDGGGPHAELLRRIAHWLMKEPDLEEEQLTLSEAAGALVIERRTVGEGPIAGEATMPDGEARALAFAQIEPGKYQARIDNAPRGLYRARSDDLFAIGYVGLEAPPEFENVVPTTLKLAPAAERTSGGVFTVGDGAAIPDIRRIPARTRDRAGDGWAGIVERGAFRTDSVRETPAASPWVWLALFCGFLFAAWTVEGRGGRLRRPSPK